MDGLYTLSENRKLARLQRVATIVSGLASRRADGKIAPATIVREARVIEAEITKQSAADGE